jgi:hypothetical protein
VVALYDGKGKNPMLLLIDGGHKTEGAVQAYKQGNRGVALTIIVHTAKHINEVRRFASYFDSRDAARTPSEQIYQTFGEEANMFQTHIQFLNTANVNIRRGCPDEDLNRIAECDPYFKRGKVLSYSNLEYIRDRDMKTLQWFHHNFPSRSNGDALKRLMNSGIVTAIILTYKLALQKGESVGNVRTIWNNLMTGEFPQDSGYRALRELRDSILTAIKVGGGERVQGDMFQRAIHGYNMVRHFGTGKFQQAYEEGTRYQIDKGAIKVLKSGKSVKLPKAKKLKKAA